jgi:hypothetical protein
MLLEIARVVARLSVHGIEDWRALVTILHFFHSSFVDREDSEDLGSLFVHFEHLPR